MDRHNVKDCTLALLVLDDYHQKIGEKEILCKFEKEESKNDCLRLKNVKWW